MKQEFSSSPGLFSLLQLDDYFRFDNVTPQGDEVAVGLQHHIPVGGLLLRAQLLPLLLREVHGYVPE